VSVPIAYFAAVARDYWPANPTMPDGLEVTIRIGLALGAGVLAVAAWNWIKGASYPWAARIRAYVQDSAWDQTLQDVDDYHRQTELVLVDGRRYAGTIRYAGREDHKAEPWIYLIYPEIYDDGSFRKARGTHGILVHRDQIDRIRVLNPPDWAEASASPTTTT